MHKIILTFHTQYNSLIHYFDIYLILIAFKSNFSIQLLLHLIHSFFEDINNIQIKESLLSTLSTIFLPAFLMASVILE